MRLGIVSDTHDQLERTIRAVELLRDAKAEVLLHCGDITGPEIIYACAVMPAYFTFGNHDADRVPELEAAIAAAKGICLSWGGVVELAGRWIALTHGHMRNDVRRALATTPDYLFTGHTHQAGDWLDGATRRINPGALHDADGFSVALVDLATDEVRFLSMID